MRRWYLTCSCGFPINLLRNLWCFWKRFFKIMLMNSDLKFRLWTNEKGSWGVGPIRVDDFENPPDLTVAWVSSSVRNCWVSIVGFDCFLFVWADLDEFLKEKHRQDVYLAAPTCGSIFRRIFPIFSFSFNTLKEGAEWVIINVLSMFIF